MRTLLPLFIGLLGGYFFQAQAQITTPTDCDIKVLTYNSGSSVNVSFNLHWTYGCFGYMEPVYVQESIGNDQNFITLDTVEGNNLQGLHERQYGQTYYYRVYYPGEDRFSAVTEKHVSNEFPINLAFSEALKASFPTVLNANGALNITAALNATGTLNIAGRGYTGLDLMGIGYFVDLDSIIVDDNYLYSFPNIEQYLYQDGTPPVVSVNNTALSFVDFIGTSGSKIYNDFLFKNLHKIDNEVYVQGFEERPGVTLLPREHKLMVAQPGDQVMVRLYSRSLYSSLHPGNEYRWYKDGALLTTSTSQEYSITLNASSADAGVYQCDIINPAYPKVTLKSNVIVLHVGTSLDDVPVGVQATDEAVELYLREHSQGDFFNSNNELIENAFKALKVIDLSSIQNDSLKQSLKDLSFLDEAVYTEEIKITHTGAETIPALSKHTELREVRLNDNQLTVIPGFSNNIGLSYVDVSNNRLTFEDLYPLKDLEVRHLKLFPQKDFDQGGVIEDTLGHEVVINLGLENPLPTNNYEWLKNGIFFEATSGDSLVIPNFSRADTGLYRCIVTNPAFPGQEIRSGEYELKNVDVGPWEAITGGPENQLVLVPSDVSADILGQPLDIGDYVGLFFEAEDGEWLCTDFAQWNGENLALTAWGAGRIPKDGYSLSEVLKMKVWKNANATEYTVDLLIYESAPPFDDSGLFTPNSMSKVNAIVVNVPCTEHAVPLYPGWNLVSSYVIPGNSAMDQLFKGMAPVLVKNDLGTILYAPQNGITLGQWDHKQGYQVFVTSPDTLRFCGTPVQEGDIIDIPANTYPYFLPYWQDTPAPVAAVMAPLARDYDYLQVVKYDTRQQRFVAANYIPSHIIDPPIDQVGNMEPGLAYRVKMNAPSRYTFQTVSAPAGRVAHQAGKAQDRDLQHYTEAGQESIENAVVVISKHVLEALESLRKGDEIAVKTSQGAVMGVGIFAGEAMAITAWHVEGLSLGNTLEMEIWHAENDKIEKLKTTFGGGGEYAPGKLMIASDIQVVDKSSFGLQQGEVMTYPNPSRDMLHVRLPAAGQESYHLRLTDPMGKVSWSKEVISTDGVIRIDVSGMEKGIYSLEVYRDQTHGTGAIKRRIAIVD